MKQLTGAQIVLECLKEQGVDTVFGYPGGAILNIYDELYKQKKDFTHILTSHEQGASHAADGYARSTGKVGVCFATSGPGATNIVTGLATANMDSVPVVAITCNVGVSLLGKDSFQEVDISGVTIPITKHNFIVKNIEELADTIRRAFRIAKTGRPGPVLIDIPKDVTAATTLYEKYKPAKIIRSSEYIKEVDIQNAISMIREAKRPYILVGGGAVISDAIENTSAGTVSGIYDMILDYDICVVGEESVDVRHVLAAIPGTSLDKIEKVYSHPQGLMQCKGFLDEHPDWDQVKVANTAISAKKVADDNKPVKAAICSERAAKMYGLEILKREVNDEGNNTTRFVIMSKKKQYRKDAGKVSISFSVPHESGSLYNILTHFMFNNVSMSNIESRPLPGRKWEYGFYVDVIGNLDDPAIRNSLAGIKEETKDFKILGNF